MESSADLAVTSDTLRRLHALAQRAAGDAGEVKTPRGAKTALVEAAISGCPGGFTLADLERACPA